MSLTTPFRSSLWLPLTALACLASAATARADEHDEVRPSEAAPGPTLASLQLQLDILKNENHDLRERVSALETATQYRDYVVGMGVQAGPGGGAFGITGRAGFIKGTYFVGRGALLLVAPEINIWGRVMFQPLGVGVMVYQNAHDTFSARQLRRTLDIAAQSAISVRIWEGVSANLALTWYVPNPGDAFKKLGRDSEKVSDRADLVSDVQKKVTNGAKIPLGLEDMTWEEIRALGKEKLNGFTQDEIGALYTPIDVDVKQDWRDVKHVYRDSLVPSVMVNLQWVFK